MFNEERPVGSERPPTAEGPDASRTGRPGEERRVTVWVGKSVVFKGELIASEDMMLDGRVEGTIYVRDHVLTIGPDADVHADINAKIVLVYGAASGSITASEKVDVRESARIKGDITAPRVAVADGADLHGRIDTQSEHHSHLTVVA